MKSTKEVWKILSEKGLLINGSSLFNGYMKEKLDLENEFTHYYTLNDNMSYSDEQKIYDYYTEVYFYIDQLSPDEDISYREHGWTSRYYGNNIMLSEGDREIISYLEDKHGFKNKFKPKRSKKPLIIGLGIIAVGLLIYKAK